MYTPGLWHCNFEQMDLNSWLQSKLDVEWFQHISFERNDKLVSFDCSSNLRTCFASPTAFSNLKEEIVDRGTENVAGLAHVIGRGSGTMLAARIRLHRIE